MTAQPTQLQLGQNIPIFNASVAGLFQQNVSWISGPQLVISGIVIFAAGPQYTVSFNVINPARGQLAATVYAMLWNSNGSVLMQNAPGLSAPLAIPTAAFAGYPTITQSSSFPCDKNTITVSFSPNVQLLSCNTSLTLQGLVTTQTPKLQPTDIHISGASTGVIINISTVIWSQLSGNLVLTGFMPGFTSNQNFSLSFTVSNPNYGRLAVPVNLSGLIGNSANSQQFSSGLSVVGGQCFGPMFVQSPSFVIKRIVQ